MTKEKPVYVSLSAKYTCPKCKKEVICNSPYVLCNINRGPLDMGPDHPIELTCPECGHWCDGRAI